MSIALTAPVDSFLWGKPLWPVRWFCAMTRSALRRVTPWRRQELEVLRFNVLDNRSSEWGTSAFHWCALASLIINGWLPLTSPIVRYLSSALPRALLGAAPLAVLGVALERRLRPQFISALVYVLLYSALPHKVRTVAGTDANRSGWPDELPSQEVRFLFPVLPLFNMCAAAALARLYASRCDSALCIFGCPCLI